MTVLAKLVMQEEDILHYITYVFELMEERINDSKYVMCVRFPNWDHRQLSTGEIGYLDLFEIRAGVDKWYDGNKFVPYNYNNIQFIKFVRYEKKEDQHFTV